MVSRLTDDKRTLTFLFQIRRVDPPDAERYERPAFDGPWSDQMYLTYVPLEMQEYFESAS